MQRGMVSRPGAPQTAKGQDRDREHDGLSMTAPMRRAHSASCMPQLTARHTDASRHAAQCVLCPDMNHNEMKCNDFSCNEIQIMKIHDSWPCPSDPGKVQQRLTLKGTPCQHMDASRHAAQ